MRFPYCSVLILVWSANVSTAESTAFAKDMPNLKTRVHGQILTGDNFLGRKFWSQDKTFLHEPSTSVPRHFRQIS